jgi:protease-4
MMRESIWSAIVRRFFVSIAAVLGFGLGIFLLFAMFTVSSSQELLPPKSEIKIGVDAEGHRELLPMSDPAILRLNIHGVIGLDGLTATGIENILLDSREDFLAGDRVKGILLHLDTPGGTATDSYEIYHALMLYKKKYNVPVHAYIDGICASGGMYIASAADKIYCSPAAMVGSVGVILGPNFNFSAAMEKYGVQAVTLTEGKGKDELNPFRPWHPGEADSIQTIIAQSYEMFVTAVTEGRPRITREKLVDVYGAHIFSAQDGLSHGYVDTLSDYPTALKEFAAACGIEEKQPYQVVQLAAPRSFLDDLAQGSSILKGKVTHTFDFGPLARPELSGRLLYLYEKALSR